jgi:mRNA (guanine-N7-)-methyltransferase
MKPNFEIKQSITSELSEILKNKTELYEFEVRFGKFNEKNFIPCIDLRKFLSIHDFLRSFAESISTEYSFIVKYADNSRLTQFLDKPVRNDILAFPWKGSKIINDTVIVKKTIKNYDIKSYGVRFSLSQESKCETPNFDAKSNPPTFFKVMKRFSFHYQGTKFDLGLSKRSTDLDTLEQADYTYDIEIEFVKEKNINNALHLVQQILMCIQNTRFLLKTSDIKKIKNEYCALVGKPKFAGVQPETLRYEKILSGEDYALTIKLDGRRNLLYIFNGMILNIDSKLDISDTGIRCDQYLNGTLLDSEIFKGKYCIFDIIFYNGTDLRDDAEFNLEKRIELMNEIDKAVNTDELVVKPYIFGDIYTNSMKYLQEKFSSFNPDDHYTDFDGIIYVPVNKPYPASQNSNVPLKWKPDQLNTIDFKIKKLSENDHEDFDTWKLYCYTEGEKGNSRQDILFTFDNYSDSLNTINVNKDISWNYNDGAIVEFYYDKSTEQFVPLKHRIDKSHGNYIGVARDNFDTIINPFDFELLKPGKARKNMYFFNMRRYHNWIKRKLLHKYSSKAISLLDLSCGKGGDISKWCDNNIRYVEGYDIDLTSIKEAKARTEKMLTKPTTKNFDYNFFHCDLGKETIETEKSFDIATCFFAIHYFFKNEKTILNFIKNLSCLRVGSYFIVTTFSDAKLKEIDYTISNHRASVTKVGEISSDTAFGNTITVRLQDSVLEHSTDEYVVNSDYFMWLMNSNGFILDEESNFEEHYSEWKKNNNFLSNDEKQLSFLNKVYVFKKEKNVSPVESIEMSTSPQNSKTLDFDELEEQFQELVVEPEMKGAKAKAKLRAKKVKN